VAGCPHGKSWVTCAPSRSTYGRDPHDPSVVSPSEVANISVHRDANCSFFGAIAGRIADIRSSQGVWGYVSVDCFNAIGTVGCCATDGSIQVYVEVMVSQFCCGVADVNCLQNNNAGDICVVKAGASYVVTKPHVIMVIRRIKTVLNGKLRSYVMGEISAMPINVRSSNNESIRSKNAEDKSAMQVKY